MHFIVFIWQNSLLTPGPARIDKNMIKYKQLLCTVCSVVKANGNVYIISCIPCKTDEMGKNYFGLDYISESYCKETKLFFIFYFYWLGDTFWSLNVWI